MQGMQCVKCGASLEMPSDPEVLHISCRFCGKDNLLPPHVVQARQQAQLERARAAYQQHAPLPRPPTAMRRPSNVVGVIFGIFGAITVVVVMMGAGVAALVLRNGRDAPLPSPRHSPAQNGKAWVDAEARVLGQQGCSTVLMSTTSYYQQSADFWVKLSSLSSCAAVIAGTDAPGVKLSFEMKTLGSGLEPPAPGGQQVFRMCPQKLGKYDFVVKGAEVVPFSVTILSCERRQGEGGLRSNPAEPSTTGFERMVSTLKDLDKRGCRHIIAAPQVVQGEQSYTVTTAPRGNCYNFLAFSSFADSRISMSLMSPLGERLPVPPPGNEARLTYCPEVGGEHKLVVTPSSIDHFTVASVDCPRRGPEGQARAKAMVAASPSATAP